MRGTQASKRQCVAGGAGFRPLWGRLHACWVLGRGRLLLSLHLVSAETGSATLSASKGGRRKLSFACKCGSRGSAKGLAQVSVAQGSMALSEALWASTCLTQAVWAWEGHRGLCACVR